jgi:hypothetical protein
MARAVNRRAPSVTAASTRLSARHRHRQRDRQPADRVAVPGKREIDPGLAEMQAAHRQKQQHDGRLQSQRDRQLELRTGPAERQRHRLARHPDRVAFGQL